MPQSRRRSPVVVLRSSVSRPLYAVLGVVAAILIGVGVAAAAVDTATTPAEQSRDVVPLACDEARNHGAYVSSIARSTPPGPGKGAMVADAARSDCGKPSPEETDADEPGRSGPAVVPPGLAKKGQTGPPGRTGWSEDGS